MPQLSGIYDGYAIQPVCKIKENLSILTIGKWRHYSVEFIEPIPAGPATVVDMVTVVGATSIAANGTIQKQVVNALQVDDNEFLHLRWEPIDPVEGVLWETAANLRFTSRSISARVDWSTRTYDPNLATTTFWIIGERRDMNLECRNPLAVALPTARFQFYGYRMILSPISTEGMSQADQKALLAGDVTTIRRTIGSTTFLPAEGRGS